MHLLFIAFASYVAMSTQHNFRVTFPAAFTPSPTLWKRDASLNSEQTVQIDIALSLDKTSISDAERSLMGVSNPSSLNFGSYLTQGEVAELFALDKHGLHEIAKWLTTSGVSHSSIQSSANGDHLFLNTTVALAEQTFQTRYSQFVDGENTHAVFEEYSLPSSVSNYVD